MFNSPGNLYIGEVSNNSKVVHVGAPSYIIEELGTARMVNIETQGKYKYAYPTKKAEVSKRNMQLEFLLDNKMEVVASSPRTVILFGEYSVLRRMPAIGLAINSRTYVGLKRNSNCNRKGIKVELYLLEKSGGFSGPSYDKWGPPRPERYIRCILDHLKNNDLLEVPEEEKIPAMEAIIISDQPGNCRLNVSGSAFAAIVAGYMKFLQLAGKLKRDVIKTCDGELSIEEKRLILPIARDCEELYITGLDYPIPEGLKGKKCSGARSLTSIFGGLVYASYDGQNELKPEILKFPKGEIPLLVVSAKERREYSREAIDHVLKEEQLFNSYGMGQIFDQTYDLSGTITKAAVSFFKNSDPSFPTIGKLMSRQQQCLEIFGASSVTVRRIISEIADKALGAKLTGAGGSGASVIVLFDGDEVRARITENLDRKGLIDYVISESVHQEEGVRIEST